MIHYNYGVNYFITYLALFFNCYYIHNSQNCVLKQKYLQFASESVSSKQVCFIVDRIIVGGQTQPFLSIHIKSTNKNLNVYTSIWVCSLFDGKRLARVIHINYRASQTVVGTELMADAFDTRRGRELQRYSHHAPARFKSFEYSSRITREKLLWCWGK